MDTLHLFNETLEFLEDCEERYNFKALRYLPVGCNNRKEWNEKYSSDLYMTNVEEYDLHAKVEPLNRALSVSALPPFSPFSLKQPHWIASDWILDRNLLLCFISFFLLTTFFFWLLQELNVDAWINGRRRDHGFDRASLDVYEEGKQFKINVLAHWTFSDCWDYLGKQIMCPPSITRHFFASTCLILTTFLILSLETNRAQWGALPSIA